MGHNDAKYNSNFCKFSDAAALSAHASNMDFQVEFADKPGQTGVQYLMEVDIKARGAGSFPVSAAEINYNSNLGNLSELAECSDRGLDNGDGECECFDGYRGLACEELEALV